MVAVYNGNTPRFDHDVCGVWFPCLNWEYSRKVFNCLITLFWAFCRGKGFHLFVHKYKHVTYMWIAEISLDLTDRLDLLVGFPVRVHDRSTTNLPSIGLNFFLFGVPGCILFIWVDGLHYYEYVRGVPWAINSSL